MVQAIKLRYTGIGLRVILAKLALRFAGLIAAFEKVVPLLEVFHRLCGLGLGVHAASFGDGIGREWIRSRATWRSLGRRQNSIGFGTTILKNRVENPVPNYVAHA